MFSCVAQLVALVLLAGGPYETGGQGIPGDELPAVGNSELHVRLNRLETETDALREELRQLKGEPNGAPATPTALASATESVAPDAPPETQFLTLDQLKGEMKKLVWTKGDYSITPYGTLWVNMSHDTARSNVGDYVLWVLPANVSHNETAVYFDAKSTRLGFDVGGPPIPLFHCARSGGKVEIDFQRQIDTENRPSVLLRHAYAEVKDEESRLLAGQTWDVVSPLCPGVLSYSVGWGGGNIGYRRAQFRGERYLAVSDVALLTLQGGLFSDLVADPMPIGVRGNHSGWPILQGRAATTLGPRGKGDLPIEMGFSGHIGEQIFDFTDVNPAINVPMRTWSFNFDLKVPITHRLGVQGELFTGENLGAFLGGDVQGVNLTTPTVVASRRPIRSRGGWIDLWYDWLPRLHTHAGYGIDDPVDDDVTGVTGVTTGGRIYNHFLFGNIIFDITPKFLIGLEATSWKTLWKENSPGETVNTAFVIKYGF